MSLFTGRRRVEARTDRPTDSLAELFRRREAPLDAGVHVDADSASRHSAVFASVDLIARMISTLPVHEFRREGGVLRQLQDPPLLESPDGYLDFCSWAYQVLDSLLKRGNAFGLVQAELNGWPSQIETVNPADVSYRRKGKYGPIEWKLDGTSIDLWRNGGQLWHMPAYVVAGSPIGLSPILYAALTISTGLAAQRFGAQWFRDGAIPTAVLSNDNEVSQAAAQLVKERWRDALMGNREPAVLGNGWRHSLVSVSPNESQFLETIHANAADVAKFFGVDPTDIGEATPGASLTYGNIEQRQIHLLVRTVGPWMVRLEKALSRLRPRPRQVKFNPDAMLRVDTMTRHKAYDLAVRDGWMSVNEIRALEDRPGIGEAGDRYLWPPLRQQLDEHELKLGSDNDPEDEPLAPVAVGANGQTGGT